MGSSRFSWQQDVEDLQSLDVDRWRWTAVDVSSSLSSLTSSYAIASVEEPPPNATIPLGPYSAASFIYYSSEDSLKAEWFANELTNDPQLAGMFVRRFLDVDADGFISPNELLATPH